MALGIEEGLSRCARFGVKPGLGAITEVCRRHGNPQNVPHVVHVAGTNGKGATCALIESSLRAAGFRTGRYTSPHLVSLTERFLLDGSPVPCALLDEVYASMQGLEGLTYFELLTAVAFELYRRRQVDWLVLETGLGGRLDATNIVEKPEVCVITRIGLDHCDWLGGTLGEIAAEKGGIIKEGVPVVLGAMPDEARETLERLAKSRNAPCIYAPDVVSTEDIPDGFALSGKFNRENALTALAALGVIGIDRRAVEKGFSSVEWQGRFQKLVWRGRRFIVDGAHNPPAMRALVDSLKEEMAQGLFTVQSVVCGFCGDKDVSANLSILREIADCGMAVSICNPRTLPADATQQQMREAGFAEATSCKSLEEALSQSPDGTVVCGSLFLAGEALAMMDAFPYKVCGAFPNETFVSA